jgi:membrane protease YdiL (CAAX protease family)
MAQRTEGPPDYDPDRPPWELTAAIGIWFFSLATMLAAQLAALYLWMAAKGAAARFERLEEDPVAVFVSVVSISFAHLLTLAACWAVVTGSGRRPFFRSLGWSWIGPSQLLKIAYVVVVVVAVYAIIPIAEHVLPERETPFERILRVSPLVRISVAFMAVATAPLTEEVVYRGVLYSALISRVGKWAAVALVTVLFGLVHFPQYWGAWASLSRIMLLSFVLTLTRAQARSIQPCFAIHLLNNIIGGALIIAEGG